MRKMGRNSLWVSLRLKGMGAKPRPFQGYRPIWGARAREMERWLLKYRFGDF